MGGWERTSGGWLGVREALMSGGLGVQNSSMRANAAPGDASDDSKTGEQKGASFRFWNR